MLASYEKSLRAQLYSRILQVALGLQSLRAQSGSGSLNSTVVDPCQSLWFPNAKVEIHQLVGGFDRTTATDGKGEFQFLERYRLIRIT